MALRPLFVETEDASGNITERKYLPAGGRITLGQHTFLFADLRRWSSLRVSEDPGYLLVLISLWLGIGALVLRYLPDLLRWFAEDPESVSRSAAEEPRKDGEDDGTEA